MSRSLRRHHKRRVAKNRKEYICGKHRVETPACSSHWLVINQRRNLWLSRLERLTLQERRALDREKDFEKE